MNLYLYFNKQHFVFSIFFSFFENNCLLLSCATSVRPSVCRAVCPSVRLSSVEIISFRGNSLSKQADGFQNRPECQ